MTRAIVISLFIGIVFAGFEGAADAAGAIAIDHQDHGHEVHGLDHTDKHDHEGDSDHHEHFCHCSVHAAALLPVTVTPAKEERLVSFCRYDSRFSSLVAPPLLRPPNS